MNLLLFEKNTYLYTDIYIIQIHTIERYQIRLIGIGGEIITERLIYALRVYYRFAIFEVISSSRHIKMACTIWLKFSFTMLGKNQSKLEHDEIREKLSKMEKKSMNHFEEIGAKIEEKVDEAISKKLKSLELIESITKKLEKLPAELQNR